MYFPNCSSNSCECETFVKSSCICSQFSYNKTFASPVMSFLKLDDLIYGGHPVSVGDDGTVFTRLSIDQLDVPADEATTSSQEIRVDDLPIEFLSDPSFVSLANDVELTVISFEDFQRDGIQEDLNSVTPNSRCHPADNTISFLDLNDYQLDCTSDELLESCLQTDSTGIESNQEVAQYLNEDLFITNLEDTIDSQDTGQLFHSNNALKIANENGNDSDPAFKFCPKDSRVLFDIGNLSLGNVPEHQGFIRLTTDDSIPASHECLNDHTRETSNAQAPADGVPTQSDDIDKSESLVCLLAMPQIGLENKATKYLDPEINITTELELINEIGQAIELDSNTGKEFCGLDCHETVPLLHNEHQGFVTVTTDDSIPASHVCFDDVARETSDVQESDNLPRQSDDINKSESLVSPAAFPQINFGEKSTNYLDSEINFTTEPDLNFEIDEAPQLENIDLSQKSSNADIEFFGSDCHEASPSLHIELIKVDTNDCDSEREDKSELTVCGAKPSYTKHKCPDSACDKTFPSEPVAKLHCSVVNGPIKPFLCIVNGCGLAFRYSSYLDRHIRSKHDGVRDHKCTECGHGFLTGRDLAIHTRKHTGDRTEPCPDPKCELTFSTRSIAATHFLVKHSTGKAFKCIECGKAFGTLSNLKEHGLTHTSVKDFVCLANGCGRAFKTNGKLKRHSLLHAETGRFQCKQCARTFRKSASLDKHFEKKHQERSND